MIGLVQQGWQVAVRPTDPMSPYRSLAGHVYEVQGRRQRIRLQLGNQIREMVISRGRSDLTDMKGFHEREHLFGVSSVSPRVRERPGTAKPS